MSTTVAAAEDLDTVDYTALERMWPLLPYSKSYGWWAYVGRTRQIRNGLVALRVSRGPRGIVRTAAGRILTRSTISGEFTAKEEA